MRILNPQTNPATDQALSDLIDRINTLENSKAAIPSSSDTWNEVIYGDRAFPNPVIVAPPAGATLSATAGTLLVNKGITHTVARTTGVIPPAWQVTVVVPFALLVGGNLTFRCAIKTASTGTVTVQLDSATPLNATGNGTAWTSDNAALVVRTDEDWSWFEVDIPKRSDTGTSIKVTMPIGLVQLPCLYYPPVVTSLPPKVVAGMKMIDPKSGQSIAFKPSEFTKPADLVPVRSRLGMMPSPNWFTTSDQIGGNTYTRTFTAPLTSLSFEFQDASNPAIGSFNLTDFATGFSQSGYWGAPTKFTQITPSGGIQLTVVVSMTSGTSLTLCVIKSPATMGKVRKVLINGEAADWIPIGDRIDATNAAQDTAIATNATAVVTNATAIALVKSFDSWDTGTEINTGIKFGTKDIYVQVWSGTTPSNASDNTLFTITGATEIIGFQGKYKEAVTANRVNAIEGAYSGSAAHGNLFKFYGNEGHFFNSTGDTRHQNCPYLVRVWYIK